MWTIKQAASELNTSTQTVYHKINKTLRDELVGHVHLRDNKKYIDDVGFQILQKSLQPYLQAFAKPFASDLQVKNEELSQRINNLELQLATERANNLQLANEIASLANKFAELTYNSQALLKNEQDRQRISGPVNAAESSGTEKKRWQFWKR